MSPEKRNIYLDADDSDQDDNQSYDSEAEVLRKGDHGGSSRNAKRRRLEDDATSDEEEDDFGRLEEDGSEKEPFEEATSKTDRPEKDAPRDTWQKARKKTADAVDEDRGGEDGEGYDDDDDHLNPKKRKKTLFSEASAETDLPGVSKPLTKKNLVASEKAVRRSGVVYLSRIPPYMKPAKLRSLLSPYGTINRIFCAPEDPSSHARRVRGGGNKKRSYVDGWVEFVRKKDAQRAVDLLNAQTIGGKKGSYYRDDIWNLVYLRGFKWHHLTEQIATENAERASRMRAEIAQTTRENKEFLQNVERAKMLEGMEAKAEAKAKRTQLDVDGEGDGGVADRSAPDNKAPVTQKSLRSFKQTKLVSKADREDQPEHVQRVLSKIF